MRAVAPRIGYPEVTLAEEQEEYFALTAAKVPYDDGSIGVVTRWRLSSEEREKVARGEDLYLVLMTGDGRPQPVLLSVGDPHADARTPRAGREI